MKIKCGQNKFFQLWHSEEFVFLSQDEPGQLGKRDWKVMDHVGRQVDHGQVRDVVLQIKTIMILIDKIETIIW